MIRLGFFVLAVFFGGMATFEMLSGNTNNALLNIIIMQLFIIQAAQKKDWR